MSKLKGDFKSIIWDGIGQKGVLKEGTKAVIAFDTDKPQCDRCYNPNRRVVVKITTHDDNERYETQNTKLCLDCLSDLIKSVNEAIAQLRLVRLVIAGTPVGDALQQVSTSVSADELQNALNDITDQLHHMLMEQLEYKAKRVKNAFQDIDIG